MSNYSLVIPFSSKDALTSGNPLKAVKGADLTTEFTAVQTAVNSKLDGAPNVVIAAPSSGVALVSNAIAGGVALQLSDGTVTGGVSMSGGQFGVGAFSGGNTVLLSAGNSRWIVSSASGGLSGVGTTGGDQGAATINASGLFINGVAVSAGGGNGVVASKATNTTRGSTTTLAADPALVATLATGIYAISMYIQPLAAAGGGGGFKFNFSSTGSMSGNYAYTGGIVGAFSDSVGQSGLTGVTTFAAVSSTSVDWVQITGTVTVLTPGVLSFQWAQNSSSAVNTVLSSGSWIQCVKVG